jgi:D-alanyl-D-alanine carboxypeptidase (penicillin-binding protein 5/6)
MRFFVSGTALSLLWGVVTMFAQPVRAQMATVPLAPGAARPGGNPAGSGHRALKAAPISAPAYVLMDAETGRVLEARNAQQRVFPASTTKTMTALLAVKYGNLDEVVTIGPNPPKVGESSIYLLQGEKFLLGDLVRAAMIKSANDSCVAIAEAVAGSVPAFARMMNEEARRLGAHHTHFVNPHGLHDAHHYTTAHDLALIAREAMKYPFFRDAVATRQTTIHGNWKQGPVRPLLNRNRLLFRWAESDGIKTGYTRQSGRCLIASATRIDAASKRSWRLISVVMKAADPWNDSYNVLALHGFARYHPRRVASAGEIVSPFSAHSGAHDGEAMVARDVWLPVQREIPLVRHVKLDQVTAPIRKGQRIGVWRLESKGRVLLDVPLVAREAVPLSMVARAMPGSQSPLPRWLGWSAIMASLLLAVSALKLRVQGARSTARRKKKKRSVTQYETSPAASPRRQTVSPQEQHAKQRGSQSQRGPEPQRGSQSQRRAEPQHRSQSERRSAVERRQTAPQRRVADERRDSRSADRRAETERARQLVAQFQQQKSENYILEPQDPTRSDTARSDSSRSDNSRTISRAATDGYAR